MLFLSQEVLHHECKVFYQFLVVYTKNMSVRKRLLEVIAGNTEREKAAVKALGCRGTSLLKLVILKI